MPERDDPLTEAAGTSGGEALGGSTGEELASTRRGEPVEEHSPAYLRTLLLLLLAATFFEGYDGSILALVLPAIRDSFNVSESELGISRAIIELGLGAAFFLARAGDRWGRRRLLLWSVLGYTVMTALTAASRDLWSFTAFQSLSRVFLGAEYAVAVTMIVEEFPKDRRARTLGIFLMCSAIGAIAVVLLSLGGVDDTSLGWRGLYLVGVIPLLFLAFFRRRLKETRRFEQHADSVRKGGGSLHVSFWEPWGPHNRRTLVFVGLVHLFRSLPLFGATAWYFYYAQGEGGLSETTSELIFLAAYGCGTAGYWACGRLMDGVGRRPTAIAFGAMAGASAFALFQVQGMAIAGLLVIAVFFGLGMAPVTGAISTELFPTYIRNQSAAWARNVFEIAGFILGPLLVGVLGDHYTGALGSIGDSVSLLVLLFFPATWLIYRHLPETKGRELEEIEAELGVDPTAVRRAARTTSRRAPLIAISVIVAIGGLVVAGIVALGDVTRRPEGAAERFLQAVSSGDGDDVDRLGNERVARALFGGTDVELSRIEVGRAAEIARLRVVPFRVELEESDRVVAMSLTLERSRDGWKVTDFAPRGPVAQLYVPSEGGPGPSGAPATAWVIAVIVVVALTGAAELVLGSLKRSTERVR
ncbi:MAG TPA: MFS transporter [Actinomycetota bacterium]|jgi:MFS family permease|nr:MFS transporter [Actinomycetota bacterium]